MNHKLKYIKLFEGLSTEEIPYSEIDDDDGDVNINTPIGIKMLPPEYNQLTDEITGYLSIDKSSLKTINGFNSLTNIGRNLVIYDNKSLIDINGFNSLKSVGGFVLIDNNKSIIEISGFDNLVSIGEYLYITYNDKLMLISVSGNLIRAVNYSNNRIMYKDSYDNMFLFNSPIKFINSPIVIKDMFNKLNKNYYNERIMMNVWNNLKEWGTQETINGIVSKLSLQQMKLFPEDFNHLYHPDYHGTTGRDVAKFNSGEVYGIF